MSDMRGSGVVCDERCGCPSPCLGGSACRCAMGGTASGGDDPNMEHKKCSCGEHCSCNPCSYSQSEMTSIAGKAHCRCGNGCTCATCAS